MVVLEMRGWPRWSVVPIWLGMKQSDDRPFAG
jgi:hypothetical protein